jgi:hypothetical protein
VTGPGNVQKPPQNQRHVRRATCGFYLAVLIGHVTVRSLYVGIGVQFVGMSGSFGLGGIADGFETLREQGAAGVLVGSL